MFKCFIGNQGNMIRHMPEAEIMSNFGSLLFPHSNGYHFHKTTFIGSSKTNMWFNSIHNYHMICLIGKFIGKYWQIFLGCPPQLNSLHGSPNRGTNLFFGETHTQKHGFLSFSCGTCVASHRWNEKRFTSMRTDSLNNCSYCFYLVLDTATAHSYCHSITSR